MLRFMCFVGCCSVLLGCSNSNELSLPGPRGQTAEAEIVVYEVVLRAILAEWPRSFSRGTVYVSFDNSTHFGNEPPPSSLFV